MSVDVTPHVPLSPEELRALRRIIREDEERRSKEAQARAAKLQKELSRRYGFTIQRKE